MASAENTTNDHRMTLRTTPQGSQHVRTASLLGGIALLVLAFAWVFAIYGMAFAAKHVETVVENCPAPCATDVPYLGGDLYVTTREEQQLIARGFWWATYLHIAILVMGHIVFGACALAGWLLSIVGLHGQRRIPTYAFLTAVVLSVVHAMVFSGSIDWVTYYTD